METNYIWNFSMAKEGRKKKKKKVISTIALLIFQKEVKVAKDSPFLKFLFLALLESLSSCLNEFPFNPSLELLYG